MRAAGAVMVIVAAGVAQAQEGGGASFAIPRGQVAQEDGSTLKWEYHHDRNALIETLPVPDGFVSLTAAGNLLLFDETLARVRSEFLAPVPITYLADDGKGGLVAGWRDGRLTAIDPQTLQPSEFAKVAGSVLWMARHKNTWIVMHASSPPPEQKSPSLHITNLALKKTFPAPSDAASAFLLDSKGQLWVGSDRGEWGGSVHRVDVTTGKATAVAMPGKLANNVYGFVQLSDGRVLAHGGVMHMGLSTWFVTRVDTQPARLLAGDGDVGRRGRKDAKQTSQPRLPISHIIESGRELLVFSFNAVFRVDPAFAAWRPEHTVDLRYAPGRPDAVGTYPALARVHALPGGNRWLLVTGGDGNLVLESRGVQARTLPHQLGLHHQASSLQTPTGLLILSTNSSERAWRFDDGRWSELTQAPPFRLSLLDTFGKAVGESEADPAEWYRVRFVQSPRGDVLSFAEVSWTAGTRVVDRWDGLRFSPLVTSHSSDHVDSYFLTPDDEVWSLNDFERSLERLADGKWQPSGKVDFVPEEKKGTWVAPLWNLEFLTTGPAPWLYYAPRRKALVRFTPASQDRPAVFETLSLTWQGQPLPVLAALVDSAKGLWLASKQGLFRYQDGNLERSTLVPEGEAVRSLTRDGRGRLWSMGTRLRNLPAGATVMREVNGMPVGDEDMILLGPRRDQPDSVIVGLNRRGVMFLNLPAKN